MNAPFFYAPDITESHTGYLLDDASARHCIQVLRRKPGDAVILTDGLGRRYHTVIDAADKKHCAVIIMSMEKILPLNPKMGIGISFTKNISRIEWFLEKATEIGITDIYPVHCRRTEREKYNSSRLRSLLIAAMLQSQQVYLPRLHEQIPFREFIHTHGYTQRFIAHCEEDEKHFLCKKITKGSDLLVLIGPEGDFSPEEITMAKDQRFIPVSLGNTRLRTETAGVVACTLMHAANEL